MSYILDGIVILIVGFIVFLSSKKGFVRTLIEVVGFFIAVWVAFTFSSPIANAMYDKIVEPIVVKSVESSVETVVEGTEAITSNAVDAIWDKMPSIFTGNSFLSISKDSIAEKVEIDAEGTAEQLAISLSDSVIKPVILKTLSAVISVILVVVLILIIKILAKYINKLFSFSIIGGINTALGGILGFVKGVVIAMIFCTIIAIVVSLTDNGFLIFKYDTINSSHIFKFLIDLSPFI